MKMSKRKILIAAVALCMVAALGGGTLAYFTSSKEITNTFYTAESGAEADDIFSIKVFETEEDDAETTEGITYDQLLPGDTREKDPTVENTGMYAAYVRLTVTITEADAWIAACERYGITDLTDIFGGYDEAKWTRKDAPKHENDTLTYVYYLNQPLDPDDKETLFETFSVPTEFDVAEMTEINGFTITVKGEAIQSANTVAEPTDTVADAYEAFTLYDAQESTTAP